MKTQLPLIDSSIARYIMKAKDFVGVSRIGGFGSFARAEQTDESDIDILYDYFYQDNDTNGIESTFAFLNMLEIELSHEMGGKKIDFTSYQGLLDSGNDKLRQGILQDVVWVYECTAITS